MSGERRYALYYTPAEKHPLTQAAARWLGRDAFDGAISSVDDHDTLVAEPRRYGFHATLKAPFRLRPGRTRQELEQAIRANFAANGCPATLVGAVAALHDGTADFYLADDFWASSTEARSGAPAVILGPGTEVVRRPEGVIG